MKWFQVVFALIILVSTASANVVISEIMYDPATEQGSDTDLEWVEIYNNGNSAVDLTNWKLDGSNFDDVVIMPSEYVVIARELVDGSDADLESYEAYYGNNDGVWNSQDGSYKAVKGSMSLVSDDFILLSSDTYADSVNYSGSWGASGNGKTLYKVNLNGNNDAGNWAESIFDGGTPGKNKNNNGILVKINVIGSALAINSVVIPDDLDNAGIQILPVANDNRMMPVNAEVDSANSVNVYAEMNGEKIQLNQASINGSLKTFNGNVQMAFYRQAGNYTINVSATDQNKKTIYRLTEFEYMPMVSAVFDIDELDFGNVASGYSSNERIVNIKNAGNVMIDLSSYATDLVDGQNAMPASSVNVKASTSYIPLAKAPMNLDLNLGTGTSSNKQLYFKINVPSDVNPSAYNGIISLIAVEG